MRVPNKDGLGENSSNNFDFQGIDFDEDISAENSQENYSEDEGMFTRVTLGGWLSCYVVKLVVLSLRAVVLPGFNSLLR